MKKVLYNIMHLTLCVMMVMSVASCRSSKKAQKDTDAEVTKPVTTVTVPSKPAKKLSPTEKLLLNVDSTTNKNYTAKVHVSLNMNGKDVSTSGSLKMRWNDVIQISLVDPIIGITEIGRMEFSKGNVLIIDRINKQYMQETYESLASLAKTDLSYEYVQALFWAESQKPDNDNITYKIPLKKPVTLNLKLSNIGHKDSWEAHTEVSSRYNKVSADQLFKSLTQQ